MNNDFNTNHEYSCDHDFFTLTSSSTVPEVFSKTTLIYDKTSHSSSKAVLFIDLNNKETRELLKEKQVIADAKRHFSAVIFHYNPEFTLVKTLEDAEKLQNENDEYICNFTGVSVNKIYQIIFRSHGGKDNILAWDDPEGPNEQQLLSAILEEHFSKPVYQPRHSIPHVPVTFSAEQKKDSIKNFSVLVKFMGSSLLRPQYEVEVWHNKRDGRKACRISRSGIGYAVGKELYNREAVVKGVLYEVDIPGAYTDQFMYTSGEPVTVTGYSPESLNGTSQVSSSTSLNIGISGNPTGIGGELGLSWENRRIFNASDLVLNVESIEGGIEWKTRVGQVRNYSYETHGTYMLIYNTISAAGVDNFVSLEELPNTLKLYSPHYQIIYEANNGNNKGITRIQAISRAFRLRAKFSLLAGLQWRAANYSKYREVESGVEVGGDIVINWGDQRLD